jgi:hypothetical protein
MKICWTSLPGWVLAVGLAFAVSAAPKASGTLSPIDGSFLNQTAIHKMYNEGNFDQVDSLIKIFAAKNKAYSSQDSFFIAKHLAVIYSANPNTREKGRYHMYRMLELRPDAGLIDMFVSDEIDRIFEKVKKEFQVRNGNAGAPETSKVADATPPSPSLPAAPTPEVAAKSGQKRFWKKPLTWVGGVAVFALAAGVVHLLFDSESKTKTNTIDVPSVSE